MHSCHSLIQSTKYCVNIFCPFQNTRPHMLEKPLTLPFMYLKKICWRWVRLCNNLIACVWLIVAWSPAYFQSSTSAEGLKWWGFRVICTELEHFHVRCVFSWWLGDTDLSYLQLIERFLIRASCHDDWRFHFVFSSAVRRRPFPNVMFPNFLQWNTRTALLIKIG